MLRSALMSVLFVVAACGTTYEVPGAGGASPSATGQAGGASRDRADFVRVAGRVEPVAETFCREEIPNAPPAYCNYRVIFETDPEAPPNAFQTLDDNGRPVIVVTGALLREMRSDDEIAFVLSHEAAHHIAQHIPKQQASQVFGAAVAGGLAAALGGDYATSQGIQDAMDFGAFVGGRAYSQRYELEADWLGAFIADRAGYNPERGAQIFGRPALASSGGPVLLSTHPASPNRLDLVAQASREIDRQRAAGLTPRPAYAGR